MQSSDVGRLCITQTIDLKRTFSCPKKLNIWMNEMAKKEKQSIYVPPMVETIELKIGAMLCQSQSPSTVNNPFGGTDEEEI